MDVLDPAAAALRKAAAADRPRLPARPVMEARCCCWLANEARSREGEMACATWRPAYARTRRRSGTEADRKEGAARVRARFLVLVACAVDMVVVVLMMMLGVVGVCVLRRGEARVKNLCVVWKRA